jgi:transposase-like protein
MAKRKRRAFTTEFKTQTVRLVRDSGKPIGVIARDLDLGDSVLRNWVRQTEVEGGRGPKRRPWPGAKGVREGEPGVEGQGILGQDRGVRGRVLDASADD